MTGREPSSRPADTLVTAPRGLAADSRLVLMAGVAGACLLGVAAGAWVRPQADDLKAREAPRSAARPAAPMEPLPQMRIVMDAEMLPARPPMEVLPDWRAPDPPRTLPEPEPFVAPPMREASSLRLVRDEEILPREPSPEPPKPVKAERPKPVKAQVAQAQDKPAKAKKAKPEKVEIAKAEKPKAKPKKAEKVQLAKAEKPRTAKAEKVALAKAEALKKAERAKAAKTKPEKVELARADKAKTPEKPKAPKAVLAKAGPKPPEKARPKPLDVLLAEIEKLKAKPAEAPPVKLAEAKPPPPPKPEPPVKIAKATTKAPAPKASARPAPRRADNPWADDDRRLARAYRRAAEAGVPEWRLERQQARWRQARDAAEREAPWAVRRVYDARIAELDDLAGEAAMEWN